MLPHSKIAGKSEWMITWFFDTFSHVIHLLIKICDFVSSFEVHSVTLPLISINRKVFVYMCHRNNQQCADKRDLNRWHSDIKFHWQTTEWLEPTLSQWKLSSHLKLSKVKCCCKLWFWFRCHCTRPREISFREIPANGRLLSITNKAKRNGNTFDIVTYWHRVNWNEWNHFKFGKLRNDQEDQSVFLAELINYCQLLTGVPYAIWTRLQCKIRIFELNSMNSFRKVDLLMNFILWMHYQQLKSVAAGEISWRHAPTKVILKTLSNWISRQILRTVQCINETQTVPVD